MYWNEYKRRSEYKNTANECIYFLESNFVGVNKQFVLIYTIVLKDSMPKTIIYLKVLLKL